MRNLLGMTGVPTASGQLADLLDQVSRGAVNVYDATRLVRAALREEQIKTAVIAHFGGTPDIKAHAVIDPKKRPGGPI